MFDHLDHVGIAVEDMETAIELYRDLFGMRVTHDESVVEQGTRVVFLAPRSGPDLELLAALGAETPVGKFLAKRGPGIHHLCYAVASLEEAIARCQARGLQMIDEVPRIGAKGKRLAFIHPKSTGGVLIELYQTEQGKDGTTNTR
ncbi:MAG: methylmalonyl-CoA epimerase [Chloroflexota bacterium]|nr:methylmalonyl-CoA epimerase [Chloroflexota bacterium]